MKSKLVSVSRFLTQKSNDQTYPNPVRPKGVAVLYCKRPELSRSKSREKKDDTVTATTQRVSGSIFVSMDLRRRRHRLRRLIMAALIFIMTSFCLRLFY